MKHNGLLLLLCLSAALLFALAVFPASQTTTTPLLEVSVLVRESDSTLWSNARQGMEQAASDFQVELRFLTPSDTNDLAQQQYTLAREISNGADGIIIAPVSSDTIANEIETVSPNLPVVSLESTLGGASVAPCISMDNTLLGETIALAALEDIPANGTVLLIDSSLQSTGISTRLDRAHQVLEEAGCAVYDCTPSPYQTTEEAIREQLSGITPDAILTFEPIALELVATMMKDEVDAPFIYGTGSTDLILSYLEKGVITMIAAQSEFSMGYYAVETLVNTIYSAPPSIITPMEYFVVRQENMYDSINQKLLFPVS